MNSEIKTQIFDVLNKGEMNKIFNLAYDISRYIRGKKAYFDIPDNIETLMLDWLEEQEDWETRPLLGWKRMVVVRDCTPKPQSMMGEEAEKLFCYDSKPRQVAIAEACCFVFSKLKDGE